MVIYISIFTFTNFCKFYVGYSLNLDEVILDQSNKEEVVIFGLYIFLHIEIAKRIIWIR